MAGIIKSFVIGMFLVLGMSAGLMSFFTDGLTTYGLTNTNTSTYFNNTIDRLNTLNATMQEYDNSTISTSITLSDNAVLGFIFNGYSSLVRSFKGLQVFTDGLWSDLMTGLPVGGLPSWLGAIVIGIIASLILFAIVALLIGRGQDEV